MLRKWRAFGVAAAFTFVAGLVWAQQSTIGGMPSRPRFQSLSVLGSATFSGPTGANAYPVRLSGQFPALGYIETDAAANNQAWDFLVNLEQFSGRVINDAGNATASWITVDRTANTVDTINLTATAVQVNGGTITSGTFTPTAVAGTNLDSVTGGLAQYMRVRDVVTMSGVITVDPTAAASTIFDISVPVVSDFANASECAGTGTVNHGTTPAVMIFADITGNDCRFTFTAQATASTTLYYTLTFRVI